MVITTQEILNSAFRKIGILGRGEVLSAEDSQDAKLALNLMLASWSIRQIAVLVTILDSLTLVAGQRVYTIGMSGTPDFATTRPKQILNASLKDLTDNVFTPIDIISEDQYLLYGDREVVPGRTNKLYYERTMPNGTITLYWIPDKAYQLDIYSQKPFTEITDLDAAFDLDEAYLEPIIYNLAVRLAPDYGRDIPERVSQAATDLFDRLLVYTAESMDVFLDVTVRKPSSQTIFVIE